MLKIPAFAKRQNVSGYSMRRLIIIILTLITNYASYGQIQDGCVIQEISGDSITRTYFCSSFNYHRQEFWEVRYFSGFSYKDTFKLADLEYFEIKEIETALVRQLPELNKNKPGQKIGLDIEKNIHNYHRQYFCYYDKDGDKILLINFLYFHTKDEIPDLSRPTFYTDGGSRFWKIKYNMRTKTFFDLKVNGRA